MHLFVLISYLIAQCGVMDNLRLVIDVISYLGANDNMTVFHCEVEIIVLHSRQAG